MKLTYVLFFDWCPPTPRLSTYALPTEAYRLELSRPPRRMLLMYGSMPPKNFRVLKKN